MEEGCENVKDGREGKAEDSVSLKSVEQGTKKGDSLDDENEGDVGKVEGLLERASRIFGASQKSLGEFGFENFYRIGLMINISHYNGHFRVA